MAGYRIGHADPIEDLSGHGDPIGDARARLDDGRQRQKPITVIAICGTGGRVRRHRQHLSHRGVGIGHRRRVAPDRRVEIQPALFDALHQQRRGRGLGDRRDWIGRVRLGRYPRLHIGKAKPAFPDDASVRHDRRR